MSYYKANKPRLVSVLYLSMRYTVLLFIRAPFYVLLVFIAMCYVFWLFWLSYQYLPNEWLERLLWGSLIVVRGSSPESPGRRVRVIFLVYCIATLFYYVCYLCSLLPLRDIFPTVMARCSLFVLKVPLNPKQTNKIVKWRHQPWVSQRNWWSCFDLWPYYFDFWP